MAKQPKPKRIADAPTAPPLHEPIANTVDDLFAYYRNAIAEYRQLKPDHSRVKDRATWLLAGDFASLPPNDADSKISELELALDYAEHAQKKLSALHCTELEPRELSKLFDAADRLSACMHELGRIAGEIGIKETSQPDPHKKRNEVIAATMQEARQVHHLYANANQCAAALVDFATEQAKKIDFHDFYLSNRTKDKLGNKVPVSKRNPVSEIDRQRTINKWLVEACIY